MPTAQDSMKRSLHSFIKTKLKNLVEKDKRLIQPKMTEYTLQAIIWDHISIYAKNEWTLSIEAFIPGTNLKADIVIYKLKQDNTLDPRYGAIAIEVKPNGQITGIKKDIKKLNKYTKLQRTPVNFGVMIFMSRQQQAEDIVKKYLRKYNELRKIHVIRIIPPRR